MRMSRWPVLASALLAAGGLSWMIKIGIIVATDGRIITTGPAAALMTAGLVLLPLGVGSRRPYVGTGQSRGSWGSSPCSGKTATRVSSTAASTWSPPPVHGSYITSTPSDISVGSARPVGNISDDLTT